MQIDHGDPIWIELTTHDLEAATNFYRTVFGWEFDREEKSPTGARIATVGGRPVAGLLSSLDEGRERRFPTSWKVFLKVDDISVATSRVASARGRIMSPPRRFDGYGYHAVVEDPAGALVILWQPEGFDGFALGSGHGQPCWFDIMSTGFDEVRNFYNSVADWVYHYTLADGTLRTSEPRTSSFRYAVNGGQGEATAGICDAADLLDEDTSSHWRMYLAVADVDEACAAVGAAGGTVLDGPRESPFGRVADIRDPQGATFRVLRSPNP